ncbi:hypothetical protein F0U44_06455 [Nocardioides humilatus]|uniref:Uncharacterized protein n=1 Tax=Nocardioides humilatus TaxID=2607660 RepID=A0A5B1LMX8_9ACTN|nr:hypothetical protein [Nocardioides humilatus]KAA1421903.1 hypothetical protein F0U44_06455 [Nocardioides humilatus]
MYDVQAVLDRINEPSIPLLVFTAIAWVTGFVQIVQAFRCGRSDRVPAAPIGMTAFLLAHDGTFALHADYWLHEVDVWYFSIFWVGMVVSVGIELMLVRQYLAFGQPLLAPDLPRWMFVGSYLLLQAFAFVGLWWLQSVVDDPLRLVSLAATQVVAVVFLVPWILARGNARGQSRAFAWATVLGPGGFALGLFPSLSPELFDNAHFWALCASLMSLSIAYLLLLEHHLRRDAAAP